MTNHSIPLDPPQKVKKLRENIYKENENKEKRELKIERKRNRKRGKEVRRNK